MNDKSETAPIFERAQFSGQIITITKDDEIAPALKLLENEPIIGFDTETKPSFRKGESYKVSLLQLSSENYALLFRLHYLKQFDAISILFEDTSVVKTGVAIRDDIKALQKLFSFTPASFIELQDVAKHKSLKNMGLKGMTEEVLGKTLSKKAKLSNWEAKELNQEQIIYAATDAWIGRKLYEALK